jgi:hypothetical protein
LLSPTAREAGKPTITTKMDYIFASFARLPRALKEILDKIYLNALQMFEIIDVSEQDKNDSLIDVY